MKALDFLASLFQPLTQEQAAKRQALQDNNIGHKPTTAHKGGNLSCTRHYAHESKTRRKMAARSRRINWHK